MENSALELVSVPNKILTKRRWQKHPYGYKLHDASAVGKALKHGYDQAQPFPFYVEHDPALLPE